MEESMLGIGKMVKGMVKELSLGLKGNGKEISMLGIGKMIKGMVKEHTLGLMEGSMLEIGRILKNGTE